MANSTPLCSVVFLHDVSHALVGHEQVAGVVELEVHRLLVQNPQVLLG